MRRASCKLKKNDTNILKFAWLAFKTSRFELLLILLYDLNSEYSKFKANTSRQGVHTGSIFIPV